MKEYPKHIDWGQVKITKDIMDGYVMPKYGKTNWMEDDSWIDIIVDDVFNAFYKDEEEEETKVAKESEDIALSIMKEKLLAMVESKKATVKDYTKLVVTDGMADYVLGKYGNNWKCEDEISSVILEYLWLKYGKGDKGKGKEAEHDHLKIIRERKRCIIQNRLEKLEVDLARAIKAKKAKKAKKSKKAEEVKLEKETKKTKEAKKENEVRKVKEAELKAKKAKEAMLAELKENKAKEAMLAEVVQISNDEDDSSDEDPSTSTSTQSQAPIPSTSNAQAASTAPIGY
ncbi:hypothetical protein Tco_0448746 [Tanacetum coccineum]